MNIYTDDSEYAEHVLPGSGQWVLYSARDVSSGLRRLIDRLFFAKTVHTRVCQSHGRWTHALVAKHTTSSQYDDLVELSQRNVQLPDGTLCIAGSGLGFHGQKKRPWAALEGNIHMAVYLSPRRDIENYHAGFPVLAAVSLIDALDAFEALKDRPQIKWVNDILIEGAKVAGFLVHTQSIEQTVLTAILGIGLNVEKTPVIKNDPIVPKTACLRSFVKDDVSMNQEKVMSQLLRSLDKNYDLLLSGRYESLLDAYRERSLVIDREVKIMSDTPNQNPKEIASGMVVDIGKNLELMLKGHTKPVTSGRLILS